MNAPSGSLFRTEALQSQRDRLHGSVSLATPLAWQAIGFLVLGALVIAGIFLTKASYARVETVSGAITLDTGVATIMPSRAGVVAALEVREGQEVKAGEVLARIRAEEALLGGDTAPDRIREALSAQDASLAAQGGMLVAAASAERARLAAQIVGLEAELDSLGAQIADQQRLVDVAAADYARVQKVAADGFISRRDLEARQATALSRRQQLSQLEQQRAAKRAAIADAQRAMAQASASAQAQLAGAQSQRAALAQRAAEADLAQGYAIVSPVDGVVTALTARLGQPATTQQPLMMVLPAGGERRVELHVPTAAAGFLRPGQDVRLAIDAFPYQQFGTVPARVSAISATTVAKQGPNGPVPVYLVTATLPRAAIDAFGKAQPLVPGMTLTARIVTENRSLLEWLFQPLFAVRNR